MKVTDVDVSKLSDSELDDLLKRVDEEELPEQSEYPEPVDEVYDDTEGVEIAPPPTVVVAEEKAPEIAVQPTAEVKVEEPVKEIASAEIAPPTIDPTLKALYDKIEGLEKRLAQPAQSQPQGYTPQPATPTPTPIAPEEFFENPDAVIERKMAEHQDRQAATRELQIREFNRRTETTKQQIQSIMPDFETYVPEMASYLKDQGIDEGLVQAFSQNPYAAQNTPMLRMLADVAKERKLRADLETKRRQPAPVTPPPQEHAVVKPGTVRSAPGSHTVHADMSKYSDAELQQLIEKGRLS